MARIKTENPLLPLNRKELRKVLLQYLQWVRAMRKDPTFYLTIIRRRRRYILADVHVANIHIADIHRRYSSPIFTSPEATNCFSINTLMIIPEIKILINFRLRNIKKSGCHFDKAKHLANHSALFSIIINVIILMFIIIFAIHTKYACKV